MRLLIPFAALALFGCDGPSLTEKQQDEVDDIAEASAHDAIKEDDRINDLESRIAELERKVDR